MLNATRSRDKNTCNVEVANNPHVKNDQDKTIRIAWWVLAVAVFSLTTAVRIRLLGIPLERDEGEYAYAGQLLLQGIPPYKLAYSMKFPGTYVAYAITMFLFGQTVTAIHLGLLLVNCATSALIFFIGKRLVNSTVGIVAAASYALLSVSPSVLGLGTCNSFCRIARPRRRIPIIEQAKSTGRRTALARRFAYGAGTSHEATRIVFHPLWRGLSFSW